MATSINGRMRVSALVVITAIGATLALPTGADAAASPTQVGSDYIDGATNSYRNANGAASLTRDGSIDRVAQAWADSMLSRSDLVHNPRFGSQMPQAGLGMWGENIAYACGYGGVKANAATIMSGWKNSSGHRRNMLRSSFTHIGIGFAYERSSDCAYAVQDFGKYSGTFTDVPASHGFSGPIEWLVRQRITTGFADGHFKPTRSVTRQETAAFLYRIAGSPSYSAPMRSPFKDLAPNAPFYREINWLADQGITTGYSDGTFRPRETISRKQIAAFFYRAAGKPATTAPQSIPFSDVSPTGSFAKEILWLSNRGITTGYADGSFRPNDRVTRESMAAFLRRGQNSIGA